ncbi:hypothetical protein DQ04_04431070 [Trypanosoma grayi]|uniref:hypothetical protein n=1 Tax=Trypanosoma grayi TaxID=71804 RepID=UPI0004F3FC88|nr:hypothetical protein DQ04_04431070 [Trypanosoma grayi]KEG09929.1 hypothetical protein DQ04_04431070 [Trypanosoma grayi]
MARWHPQKLLLLVVVVVVVLLVKGVHTAADVRSVNEAYLTHLYCQPISEATPATPMIGRFPSPELASRHDGKRVRVVAAPWPSIVGREYWLDSSWDNRWVFFHDDVALRVPGRPVEEELLRLSDKGLVEGSRVVTVLLLH